MDEVFEQYRGLLMSIAYRMLSSIMDAEDVVQEAYLRWQSAPQVDSARAFLCTVVTRLCIDQLRSAQAHRETYIGPWLPEPVLSGMLPAESAAMSDSLSTAFLIMLESLSPIERAVFLLREVFDYEYNEIAQVVEKSDTNCRQMVSRAHERLKAKRARFPVSRQQQEQLTGQFLQTLDSGDMEGLLSLLSADIVSYSDGGGKVRSATRPVVGPDHVARFFLGILKKAPPGLLRRPVEVNGQPGLVTYLDGQAFSVITADISEDGKIRTIYQVTNPDKLRHLQSLAKDQWRTE